LKLLREFEWRVLSKKLPYRSIPEYPIEKHSGERDSVSEGELDLWLAHDLENAAGAYVPSGGLESFQGVGLIAIFLAFDTLSCLLSGSRGDT
jgi:hypothetical protein